MEAVKRDIAPVLATHGFAISGENPYVVKFTSANVVLAVSHDRISYEIDVSFAPKADPSRRYSLRDILDLSWPARRDEHAFFQASQPGRIAECVRTIAGLLRDYGKTALTAEPATLAQMDDISRVRNEAYTKEVIQTPIRKAAEARWQDHDYVAVRDLYGSIESDLTQVEKKRLEYARSFIAGHQ